MNIFKKLRKEKGLTQAELANLLEIDQTTVSKWELDKAIPDTALLIRLSRFFDVSTDYLLGISILYYPDKLKMETAQELSKEEDQMLTIFRRLPADLQGRAVAYMQKLEDLTQEENGAISPIKKEKPRRQA